MYFDTNSAIVETFGAAGYAVPEDRVRISAAVADARALETQLKIVPEPLPVT